MLGRDSLPNSDAEQPDEPTACRDGAQFASSPVHLPVMVQEVIQFLKPRPGSVIVDGTLGGGGHALPLAERVGNDGLVIGIDRDPRAVQVAQTRIAGRPVKPVHGNYADLPDILQSLGIDKVDGILLDLGVSSDQLEDNSRGFSFLATGLLDMRFDPTAGTPAYKLLEQLSEKELADIIFRYGEERYSRRIARAITSQREKQPIRTAEQLAQIIRQAVPKSYLYKSRIDPATRTFQALRIAVNDELGCLERGLRVFPDCLKSGGRCVIISFHSLEDRIVKLAFRDDDRWRVLTKKPVRPSPNEVARNPRARSAKLRAAERL